MSKFIVEKEELLVALKKASMAGADVYRIGLSSKQTDAEGNSMCSLTACDGNVQVTTAFFSKLDGITSEEILVGNDFAAICNTMADLEKPFEFEKDENTLKIKCAGAISCVSLKKEGKLLPPKRDEKTISLQVKSENLKKAIVNAGYCAPKDDSRNLKNVFSLNPMLADEHDLKILCYTSDSFTSAGCYVTTSDKWHAVDFYTTFESIQPFEFTIPDKLLIDDFIKYKGYPLKGRGFAYGIYYKNGKTYIDFIMTDMYYAHIKVQCDSEGKYIPNGDIIFPTGWDTEEKQEKAILKSMKFIQGEPLIIKAPQPKQMNIFDFINN